MASAAARLAAPDSLSWSSSQRVSQGRPARSARVMPARVRDEGRRRDEETGQRADCRDIARTWSPPGLVLRPFLLPVSPSRRLHASPPRPYVNCNAGLIAPLHNAATRGARRRRTPNGWAMSAGVRAESNAAARTPNPRRRAPFSLSLKEIRRRHADANLQAFRVSGGGACGFAEGTTGGA